MYLSFSNADLGTGSFGYVRRATRIVDKKQVAIKVIPKRNVKGHFDMVYAEMKVLEGLSHPNVIGFFEWFESRYVSAILLLLPSPHDLLTKSILEKSFIWCLNCKYLENETLHGYAED